MAGTALCAGTLSSRGRRSILWGGKDAFLLNRNGRAAQTWRSAKSRGRGGIFWDNDLKMLVCFRIAGLNQHVEKETSDFCHYKPLYMDLERATRVITPLITGINTHLLECFSMFKNQHDWRCLHPQPSPGLPNLSFPGEVIFIVWKSLRWMEAMLSAIFSVGFFFVWPKKERKGRTYSPMKGCLPLGGVWLWLLALSALLMFNSRRGLGRDAGLANSQI